MRAFLLSMFAAFASPALAEEVAVFAGDLRLSGSFEEASGPAALILAGSGPTDRHGNAVNGLSTDAYAMLARGLASEGIASIRADKRGVGSSTGDGNAVTLAQYASDAGLWVEALRQRTGQPCIWLIGHSEGGLIALQAAQTRDDLCGLILLATPGRGFDEILIEQLAAAPAMAPHMDATRAFLARLKAGDQIPAEEIPAALAPIFPTGTHDYMRDLLAFDPIKVAQATALPVLVVQGGQDLQVTSHDAKALSAALPNASHADFPDMTHMLKDADGSQAANLATYTDALIPLTPGLSPRIASFITAQ